MSVDGGVGAQSTNFGDPPGGVFEPHAPASVQSAVSAAFGDAYGTAGGSSVLFNSTAGQPGAQLQSVMGGRAQKLEYGVSQLQHHVMQQQHAQVAHVQSLPATQLVQLQPNQSQQHNSPGSSSSTIRPATSVAQTAGAAASAAASANTITSSDACANIVHCLMCYHRGREEEFSRKAIESLIKKLKDKRGELDALIQAVVNGGKVPTECITIPRTLDGRLQVAGRKGFPHVVYAKIWRWPDLHKNELKHTDKCRYGFEVKEDLVCVNPYHYERVVSPGLGNFDLSSLRIDVQSQQQQAVAAAASRAAPHSGSAAGFASSPAMSHSAASPRSSTSAARPPHTPLGSNVAQHQALSPCGGASSSSGFPALAFTDQQALNFGQIPFSAAGPQPQFSSGVSCSSSAAAMYGQQNYTYDDGRVAASSSSQAPQIAAPLSQQPLPEHWCTVSYYEYDTQVGETYRPAPGTRCLCIDGGVDPNAAGRFCLGALPNVHRNDVSEKARQFIGRGVRLDLYDEGDVWLEVLSEKPVFAMSYYLDRESGKEPSDNPHKIYPGQSIKVFDLRQCYESMRAQATGAQLAARAQAAAVAGNATPLHSAPHQSLHKLAGLGVDDLRRACMFSLSFVKGWGPNYTRAVIKDTPCWCEVHVNRALQLLDSVLHSMPNC